MSLDTAGLFEQPERFACGLHPEHGKLDWTETTREELDNAAFLDERFLESRSVHEVDLRAVLAYHDEHANQAGNVGYIFHTSFCCSTLLARCLSVPGVSLALKEPSILLDVANFRRRHSRAAGDEQFTRLLSLTARLLGKRFGDESVVVKPTNTANNLAAPLLALPSTSAVLLLYGELRDFLVSVAKYGTKGRSFFRRLFRILRYDADTIRNTSPEEAMVLTDLQMAATVWYGQMRMFQQLALRSDQRISSLSSETFLNNPRKTLEAAAGFFGLSFTDESFDQIEERGLLGRDSKFEDRFYDASQRLADRRELERNYGTEIDEAIAWLNESTRQAPVGDLPNTLCPVERIQ